MHKNDDMVKTETYLIIAHTEYMCGLHPFTRYSSYILYSNYITKSFLLLNHVNYLACCVLVCSSFSTILSVLNEI